MRKKQKVMETVLKDQKSRGEQKKGPERGSRGPVRRVYHGHSFRSTENAGRWAARRKGGQPEEGKTTKKGGTELYFVRETKPS